MSLTLVSVPIGNWGDVTVRGLETLKTCEVLICEEIKPAQILYKRLHLEFPANFFQLNEHSRKEELVELVAACRTQRVALITDAGTPGFCDPGADLVEACRKGGIPIHVNPGVTSLTALLSLTGERLGEFHFVGFLPAEKEARQARITGLKSLRIPFVIMDTPYRLNSTLKELAQHFPQKKAVVGVDLTGEKHQVGKDALEKLAARDWPKLPFVLMVFP